MSDEQTGTAQRDAEATPLPMSRHSLDEPAHTSARSPVAAAGAVNSDTIQEEAAGFDERNSTDLDTGSRDAGIRRASVLSSASDATSRVVSLEAELERVTGEKDHLETQYRSLLGKLTTMRSTLGEKLRQDAVSPPCWTMSWTPDDGLTTHNRTNWIGESSKYSLYKRQTTICAKPSKR